MTLKQHAELAHGHEPYMAVATHFWPDDTYIELFLGWSRSGLSKALVHFVERSAPLMEARGVHAWIVELKPAEDELRPEAICGICGWDPYEMEKELN